MKNFLEKILDHKKELLLKKKAFYSTLKKKFARERLSRYRLF